MATVDLLQEELGDDDLEVLESAPAPASRRSMPPPAPRSSRPTPPPPPAVRSKERSAIDILAEAIGELEVFGTPAQAAGICAAALAKVLGARAVLVHSHDRKARALRTIAAELPKGKSNGLVGAVQRVDDDLLASIVVGTAKPMTLTFAGPLPRTAPQRLRTASAQRTIVATPAISAATCVAVIEVIDPEDPCAKTIGEACGFVAERLASFLGAKK